MKRSITFQLATFYSVLLILGSLFLMGAILPIKQTEPATLRIYKKGYSGYSFGIKINEQLVVDRLKNRSWLDIEVPAGKLILETVSEVRYPTYKGKSFSLEVEAGKLYYLEAVIDYEFWTSTMYLILREKERAEKELKRFRQNEYILKKVE